MLLETAKPKMKRGKSPRLTSPCMTATNGLKENGKSFFFMLRTDCDSESRSGTNRKCNVADKRRRGTWPGVPVYIAAKVRNYWRRVITIF